MAADDHYDWIIVGSGFGGSVSALRLSEKGYRVLVLEKGRRWRPEDFARSNWDLKRWLWMPQLGFTGIQQLTFMRHVTVLSGVGVGGGSLVYANTLPVPQDEFFEIGSWAGLADWKAELAPHYATAQRMLGATTNQVFGHGDDVLKEIAADLGRQDDYHPTQVAVYFGEPGKTVADPFFGGRGPERTGCIACGGCMLGCRHGAKNTLDKNYLWLAEQLGCEVLPDTKVEAVRPVAEGGYRVETRTSADGRRTDRVFTADRVVLAGGVMGTVELLLRMRDDPNGLPGLSPRVGHAVRTNSEALLHVVSRRRDVDHSKGIAIGSILHTDAHSHIEPVRYPAGSGFFRTLLLPHAPGDNLPTRLARSVGSFVRQPLGFLRALLTPDFARHSTILLYMRTVDGTLRFVRGKGTRGALTGGLDTELGQGESPAAFIPEATELAERFAEKMDGIAVGAFSELLAGIPTTAHILGGACIGRSAQDGVIDVHHQVFGYPGLFVVDGAAVSANPGVNPSLTITAMAERAMSAIPPRG